MSKEAPSLEEELEQFRVEQERVRNVIGAIGGSAAQARDKYMTIIFTIALVLLFFLDFAIHFMDLDVRLPPMFSVEIGVLLVSLKIIWMIHRQTKVEHFQFWILHSIEFRVNDISKRMRMLEKSLDVSGQEDGA